jgi:transposase-like protein
VDSEGSTIDFFLSPNRDAAAAKQFFRKALRAPGHPRPRVINVDGNPSYPKVIAELKASRELGPPVPLPASTVLEQQRGAGPPLY